jgi:hypothetical protein
LGIGLLASSALELNFPLERGDDRGFSPVHGGFRAGIAHAAAPRRTLDCKPWFSTLRGWKTDCLASLLKDERYFYVFQGRSDEDLDKKLQQYVERDTEGVVALLLQADHGMGIARFLHDSRSPSLEELEALTELLGTAFDAAVAVPKAILTIVPDYRTIEVVSNLLGAAKTIYDGIQTYGLFAKVLRMKETRFLLNAYKDARQAGRTAAEAWVEVAFYDELIALVGSLRNECTPENRDGCKAQLAPWFEEAYAAYRLVGFRER